MNNLGLSHFWEQADSVSHAVAYILLLLSMLSWYFILAKVWLALRVRRSSGRALEEFWSADSIERALQNLQADDPDQIFSPLAEKCARAAQHATQGKGLNAQVDPSELITRTLRQEINQAAARLESGQTLLASVGSTAPFIGLFGTVWGIYHALMKIGASGETSIDKIAGPVGEALVMTALGLAVAIPAVLAYNALIRAHKAQLAKLNHFAHDLHAYWITGARIKRDTKAA